MSPSNRSNQQQYPVTYRLEQQMLDAGIDIEQQPYRRMLDIVGELEHSGMEPEAYSVSLEQYAEVVLDQALSFTNWELPAEQLPLGWRS